MNKKYFAGIIIILVLVVVVFWVFHNENPTTGPIVMGFIAPLSGDAATLGETEKNATEIALAEINQAGGIDGREMRVVYEDGKCNAKDALTAFEKLRTVDLVNVVLGGTCSSETLAIAPAAEKNKILVLSAFSSNPEITKAGDFIFRNSPSDTDAAKIDAETIVRGGYKKVAMLTENTDYSLGVREVMKKIFAEQGVEVVLDEVYGNAAAPTTDFRSLLLKVKASGADAVYLNPGSSTQIGGVMVKQARELAITMPIHGNFALATPDALTAGGSSMEGVVSGDGTGLNEKGKTLLAKYRAQFGKDPANEYEMGAAYDRVYLIRDAIEEGGTDSAKIKNYLYQLDNFSGAIGDYHFDQNGDVVGVGFVNVVIKNGQKTPI